ncbi:MAG: hypothetical protein SXA11_06490 [Cyanobacteriota bacterium]|nr:hypothetical protein [Cyanobacteriota bacterium]
MQVKDMTVEELKALIRDTVEETLEDFLGEYDPDAGLEIQAEIKQQLLEMRQGIKAGKRGIPAEEVYHKLGLFEASRVRTAHLSRLK